MCIAAAQFQAEFTEKARRWSFLDSYYIPTRYPNGLPDGIPAEVYTREAAAQAVLLAEDVVGYVKRLIERPAAE